MGRKIEITKSDLSDTQIRIWDNEVQTQVTHLTWEQLQQIVEQGQRLLDSRNSAGCGLTERDRQEMDDEDPYCDDCRHCHTGQCPPADKPCGSYLCCIN